MKKKIFGCSSIGEYGEFDMQRGTCEYMCICSKSGSVHASRSMGFAARGPTKSFCLH